MSLKTFLYNQAGNYLMVRNSFLVIYGPSTAIWVAELLYRLQGILNQGLMKDDDEWFYCEQSYIEKRTGISAKTQSRIIKVLVDDNVIEVAREQEGNMVHRNLYRINQDEYMAVIKEGESKLSIGQNGGFEPIKMAGSNLSKCPIIYNKESYNESSKDKKTSLEGPAEPVTSDPFKYYTKRAKEICLYWNENLSDRLPKLKIADTKAFKSAMMKIEMACKKYSVEDIATAMEHYHTLLGEADTILNRALPSHRVSLANFFGFDDFTLKGLKPYNPVVGIKSWFDEALNGEDYLLDKYSKGISDEYPEVSAIIKKQWEKSQYHIGSLTANDKNNFVRASNALVHWLDKNEKKYRIDSMFIDYPQKFVIKYLFPALKDDLGERDPKMVRTNWIANDAFYERTLHLYLKKLGL